MSPERDEPNEDQEPELYDDVPPRSIFAATWFRVVLVVIVLGVVGAVAVPYVLDWMNPPPPRTVATPRSSLTPLAPAVPPTGDTLVPEKKDSTVVPAPVAPAPPALASPPARVEPKSEAKPNPSAASAKPAAEPKPAPKAAGPEPKRAATSAEPKGQSAMAVTDSPPKPGAAKPNAAKPGAAKPEAAPKDETTQATAAKPTTPKRAVAKATTPATAAATGGAPYWVQIGAFKDPETAKRVAAKLREENFKVEESIKHVGGTAPSAAAPADKATTPAPAGSDQYDVFVTGMSVEELNRRLAGKGLAAEASGGGVVVKPSQPLRDAVALSKDLAVEGFKVQVRRSGAAASAPAIVSAPAPAAEGGQALHRVRVGAFTDRAAAQAAARELVSKGFKPYIARGDQ